MCHLQLVSPSSWLPPIKTRWRSLDLSAHLPISYIGMLKPEWRNWQTRQVEGLVGVIPSAGSSPVSGIGSMGTCVD